jgi:uncharacterized Zn-binding protein involved in type VI secretion
MPEATRVGDQVAHSNALLGLVTGLVLGAAIAAIVVFTGGAALPAIAVAACVWGSLGAMVGEYLGSCITGNAGAVSTGSPSVMIEHLHAARAIADTVLCHPGEHIAQGSETVFINRYPAARKGDKTTCDGTISEGASTVIVGSGQADYMAISGEVPWWLELGVFILGLVGGVGEFALSARAARIARLGARAVNGNSLLSQNAQHVYQILRTDTAGNTVVFKYGISGGRLTAAGRSARAERQVRALTRAAGGQFTYQSSIVQMIPGGPGARAAALAAERTLVYQHLAVNLVKPIGNLRP